MDWQQLWTIASAPDNVPIVGLLFLVPFYTWYGFHTARRNDRLIEQLSRNPDLAKVHHRTPFAYREDWPKSVHVWPYLLKIEFLAAIIVTFILFVWSITLNAPLEEPANPSLTMNPSKAPWYFLGLQEMLVYFDPWIAGVVLPTLIIFGLIAIPYCDVSPLGNGYYTWRQRKFAVATFCFGFLALWLSLIVIGTFIRGPGWQWFWPGMAWDHHRVIHEVNRDLDVIVLGWFGMKMDQVMGSPWVRGIFGAVVCGGYYALAGFAFHRLFVRFKAEVYARMNIIQYATMHFFMLTMMALPVKIVLRLSFTIKYVWVTPWFNI
ncbi:MAG: cytochrome C [Planctomycetes bacterium]|nr:cytochrome C [Planctomycetota bacterium]